MDKKSALYGKPRIKMRKKLISFITVLAMITALLPVFELPVFAAAVSQALTTAQ